MDYQGLKSVGYNLPKSGSALVTIGGAENREKLLQTSALLKKLGFKILATETTAEFFKEKIGDVEVVHKISEPERKPNIADLLYEKKIDFTINIPSMYTLEKYVERFMMSIKYEEKLWNWAFQFSQP